MVGAMNVHHHMWKHNDETLHMCHAGTVKDCRGITVGGQQMVAEPCPTDDCPGVDDVWEV